MEIKRMKEDVRAAREKNGVYISHERFAKEEAEKKAKDERIEQIENDLSLSQKEKLEKTSNSLRDLQENYRMVVSTLKEKEYTISKLLKSVELKSVNCLLLHLVKITTSFAEIQQKDLCFRAKFGESSLLEEIFSMLYCMAIVRQDLTNLTVWHVMAGEIQGAYQIKITTTALILLLASRHNELTRVNILGHLIKEKFKVLIIVVENDEFFPRGRSTLMNVDDVIIETSLGRSI
ncbi:hypothetical protein Ahy_A09g043133 isoform B [Arachis hypogaea]|uniref:Uncharacterized protein n=1 Tax=Arachis hypogaea TaxID=3818 RepID=A0A445BHK8_ARAHY|nr:hypothetical protein Ahy_A09g043133 isoform B [Arachis hypogaea]